MRVARAVFMGKILPPKESARERGYNWAKAEVAKGTPVNEIEAYLNGSDGFDLGARDFLAGIKPNT
jgi:hypothetical protein